MLPLHLLDEDAVEALLTGRPVTPGLAPLAGAVGQLRAAARQPVRPSDELARRMASGDFSGIPPAPLTPEPAGRRRIRTWLAGVSPRARVVTGAVVVFTGLTAATAAGALPGAAQAHVEKFIETVTPISFQHDEPGHDVVEDVSDTSTTTEPDDTGRSPDPGEPVRPPGKPETPPGKPPEKPDNPNKPEEPPGKPENPGRPTEQPDNPNKPETPPGKPQKPEPPDNEGNGNGNSGGGNSGNGQGNSGNNGNGNSGNGNNGNGNGP